MNTNNTERTRQEVREFLFQTFASEGNSKASCAEIMERFDNLTDNGKMSAQGASKIIYSSYGSTDGRNVLNQVGRFIFNNLEHFNTEFPKISLDSKQRLKRAIETLSSNIDKVSIVFNGQELSAKEISAIKPKMPIFCRSMTVHQASASSKGSGLTIDVMI
jgi:hypothetical protein